MFSNTTKLKYYKSTVKYYKSTMKYQKSMLKIYELLILNRESIILEDIIKKASVGRTSGFKAIKWLENKGFIQIKTIGKQKEIKLKKDRYTLNFKTFMDALKFKELNEPLKYNINLFIENIKNKEVKCILLFGSSLTEKKPEDIDLLIICSNKEDIIKTRNKIEPLTDFILNLHFNNDPSDEILLNSVCLFGFDHYIKLLENKNKTHTQFSEAINWLTSAYNNIKDKNLFDNCLNNVVINLSFTSSSIKGITVKTKNEAKTILFKQYKKLNKMKNLKNIKKFEIIKEVTTEIGKEIFK